MLTIREVIKTCYNALLQRLKKHRGNWEQNDPTADDYIKNRPFYSDEIRIEEVLSKTTVETFYENEDVYNPFIIDLKKGVTYTVIFDGVEYKTTAKEYYDEEPFIGNSSILGWNDNIDTGEPFFIDVWYGDGSKEITFAAQTAGVHTISVMINTGTVHKLDSKYLPDGMVTEDDLAPVAFSGDYWDLANTPTIYNDVVRYQNYQSLTTANKTQVLSNICAVGYESQLLTNTQKTQARYNIGAGTSNFDGKYNSLDDKPCYVEDVEVKGGIVWSETTHGVLTLQESYKVFGKTVYYFEKSWKNIQWDSIKNADYCNFFIADEPVLASSIAILNENLLARTVSSPIEAVQSTIANGAFIPGSGVIFGNLGLLTGNSEDDTGEQTVIYYLPSGHGRVEGPKILSRCAIGEENTKRSLISVAGYNYIYHTLDSNLLPDSVPVINTATVGQVVTVKSVDENGAPTDFEAIDIIPTPTTEDEGKYLKVVNGKIVWSSIDNTAET